MSLAVAVIQENGMWELLGVVETQAAGRDVAEAWWALRQERDRPSAEETARETLALARFDGEQPDFNAALSRFDGACWQQLG